jgi:hypothetical protein
MARLHPGKIIKELISLTHKRQFLKKMGKNNYYYLWRYLIKNTPQDYQYFFKREQYISSLLFFFPLGYLESKKTYNWLDIGSGIFTHYKNLELLNPRIKVFSLETSFYFQYLSQIFYPASNITRICSSLTYGQHFSKHTLDVITSIDSLHQIPQQKYAVELATNSGILKKNGFFFVSSLFEHAYFDPEVYFPISKRLIRDFFDSAPVFFDNAALAIKLKRGQQGIDRALVGLKEETPRFCLLWPKRMLDKKWYLKLPTQITSKAHILWNDSKPLWQNKVF